MDKKKPSNSVSLTLELQQLQKRLQATKAKLLAEAQPKARLLVEAQTVSMQVELPKAESSLAQESKSAAAPPVVVTESQHTVSMQVELPKAESSLAHESKSAESDSS